jgi:hypothetical protein
MGRSSRYFILGLRIVRLFLPLAYAQKTSGTIRGVITDPSGAVVTNATVVVRNDGTGSTRAVNTNGQGEYVALELLSGAYVINVQAPGLRKLPRFLLHCTYPARKFKMSSSRWEASRSR